MGKAKKKKSTMRHDPYARPDSAAPSKDDDVVEEKPMSAHKQRHLERKRLQAEAIALKSAKKKVSKADKLAWVREQRELSMNLKVNKAALQKAAGHSSSALKDTAADGGTSTAAPTEAAAPSGSFTGFNLPAPRGGAAGI